MKRMHRKIRHALLAALLALALASCSLAEDVTPPPGYVLPTTSASTPVPPTKTPLPPTATLTPTATETLPPATDSSPAPEATAAAEEASATPAAVTGAVSGTVVMGSGGALPSGLTVTLRGFDMPKDETSQPTEPVHLEGDVQADGSYLFENIEIVAGRIFLAEAWYQEVPYQSDYVIAGAGSLVLPVLTLHETTDDFSHLRLEQVQIVLDDAADGLVQVAELFVFSNPSLYTVTVEFDGSSIPFLPLPAEASQPRFERASGSSTFIGTENGFAIRPLPAGQKYGLVVFFTVPYARRMTLEQPFPLGVTSLTLYAPASATVKSDALTDKGVQTFSGDSFHVYSAADIPAGKSLVMKISGMTPSTASRAGTVSTSLRQWLIIGLGTAGMALIGIGLYLFVRDRRRAAEEEEEDVEEARNALLDEIIALDDRYKAGEISKSVYEKRRAELKARVKELG